MGIVALAVGLGLLSFVAFAAYRLFGRSPGPGFLTFIVACALVGLFMGSVGLRLAVARPRPDGGLLSPWVIRFGGLLFILSPFVMLAMRSWHVIEAGVLFAAGVACFVLANRREERTHGAQPTVPADGAAPRHRG